MSNQKSIIFIMGVSGHLYLSRALAKEFDCPIVGLVNFARLYDHITPNWKEVFSDIRSLPDFYLAQRPYLEKLSRAELDQQQSSLEEKLGIESSATLACHDRALRWAGDYMSVRRYQLATLQFVDKIFSEIEPAFVLDHIITYLQHVIRAVCIKKNIPFLVTGHARTLDRICLITGNGQQIGMREIFDKLQTGYSDVIDKEILEKADNFFNSFINKPIAPSYEHKNSVLGFNWQRFYRKLSWVLRPANLFPSEKISQVDRKLNYEAYPLASLYSGIRTKWRNITQSFFSVFDQKPDLDVPFFYLPLHHTPEVSDLYYGAPYDHHAGFVAQLAKHLPSDIILYVKEHTSMMGRRPTSFYRELNKIYNVQVLHPSVSTFHLSQKARAIITVTGTAGWEAFLLGRPVITLGNVFYNFLPGVLFTKIDEHMTGRIKAYLQGFKSDDQTRLNGFRAYYATTMIGTQGDIGNNITLDQADENAKKYARSLHLFLKRWSPIIEGQFPPELNDVVTEKTCTA